jgi:dihydroorotase
MVDAVKKWDTLIHGGRLIDPANGLDGMLDVAVRDGVIAEIGKDLTAGQAHNTIDATGMMVVPGLTDLHTHIYHKATAYGVDPDPIARRAGVTTMVDAGSAGAGNFAGLREFVFRPSSYRLLAYVNISYPGIFAFDKDYVVGEAAVRELLSVSHCCETVEQNRDVVVGVKVRLGANTSGDIGLLALDRAIEAAERCDLPVMTHIGKPPPTYAEILARLRPGDVLTHCFRPAPNAPVDDAGSVLPALREARERGVLFDIGHGMGAFGFHSAESSIEQDFPPDIISSDVHALCVDGPAHDLLHTMSKLINCGVPVADAVSMATWAPARAMRRPELGHLTVGASAEISFIDVVDTDLNLVDVLGETRRADTMLRARGVFLRDCFIEADPRPFEHEKHAK